eukprot:scaffold8744_cov28-Phaeocystis_antarctica.AAC.1
MEYHGMRVWNTTVCVWRVRGWDAYPVAPPPGASCPVPRHVRYAGDRYAHPVRTARLRHSTALRVNAVRWRWRRWWRW